jgi:hypothetical protein
VIEERKRKKEDGSGDKQNRGNPETKRLGLWGRKK